jgi:hypothetical protein
VEVISHTEENVNIMVTLSINHHVFAVDEQLYESNTVGDTGMTGSVRQSFKRQCVSDVSAACMHGAQNADKNAGKTDLALFGTQWQAKIEYHC